VQLAHYTIVAGVCQIYTMVKAVGRESWAAAAVVRGWGMGMPAPARNVKISSKRGKKAPKTCVRRKNRV
jgi:hypothetical protein